MRFARVMLMAALVAGTGVALAQDGRPDARLAFSSTSFGLLFGYQQGQGALEFQGSEISLHGGGHQGRDGGFYQS